MAGVVALSPFWVPNLAFDDGFRTPAFYPAYPYARSEANYMLSGLDYEYEHDCYNVDRRFALGQRQYLKTWALRLSIEDGSDFGNLNRLTGRFFLDNSNRFGFLANFDYFSERLGNGRIDDTLFSDYNLTFRFVQNGWMQMHTGIGIRHQLDRFDDQVGCNFLYRAEFYPVRPLHIESVFAIGNLNEAMVLNGRLAIGANYRNLQFFTGYDFLKIGDANLQGPFVGLRLWF